MRSPSHRCSKRWKTMRKRPKRLKTSPISLRNRTQPRRKNKAVIHRTCYSPCSPNAGIYEPLEQLDYRRVGRRNKKEVSEGIETINETVSGHTYIPPPIQYPDLKEVDSVTSICLFPVTDARQRVLTNAHVTTSDSH